eukprot:g9824.t1
MELQEEHVPELLEWLCNPHPDGISSHVRRVAAELLGDVRTSELRVAEALRGALRSDEAELRKVAIQSLGKLHAHIDAIALALTDLDPTVRRAAAHALSGCGPRAAPSAAAQLGAPSAEARSAAQRALLEMRVEGEPGEEDGRRLQVLLPALHSALSLLDDPSESTRLAALCRLEASPPSDAAAGARLGMALQDDAEAVRAKAVQLLKGVPSECLQGALVVAEDTLWGLCFLSVRRAAAAVLELDPARSDSLTRHVALLKDEDPNLRCAAAEALGEASKLKELEELGGRPLAQFLSLSIDPHWAVRLALAESLQRWSEAARRLSDLFLPVRLPPALWAPVFERLWESLEEPCWSVKVLDLEREVVKALIQTQLGAFVVPSKVHVEDEDFDFEQEEFFDRWNAADGDLDEDGPWRARTPGATSVFQFSADPMLAMDQAMEQSPASGLFLVCCLLIAVFGFLLAHLEGDPKGGYSNAPTSHLHECADSADLLFSDLFSDGTGLGPLEPLWRLFTLEGALWTLLTGWDPRDHASSLGLSGMLEALGSLGATLLSLGAHAAAAILKLGGKGASKKEDGKEKLSTAHEKIQMTFLQEAHAYWGYYIVRACAVVLQDDISVRYVKREKWSVGWTDFYLQHMYKLYVDCFARPISSAPDAKVEVVIRERAGGDLFGPLNDLKLTEKRKTARLGWSTSGTRTEGGTKAIHQDLEREVAKYLSKEDALVLGMGFATNSTILPALFEAKAGGTGILVLSDELNHRSIVEGVRLSGCTVRAFQHNNMTALETELNRAIEQGQASGKPWRKIFVVVEGIYSMEGDFCRLREIVSLKNKYGAYLYLDEAHSIGAVGRTGRGVTELLGVPTREVDVMMGTFTKSFGSAGGYVAASKEVIAQLRRVAPGSVFAGAMAPPCAAQALQALRVISGEEGGDTGAKKLAAIRENANYFREELSRQGFKAGKQARLCANKRGQHRVDCFLCDRGVEGFFLGGRKW